MYKSDYRTEFKKTDPRHEETMRWISENLKPRKTPNRKHSSYGIKHLLQMDTDIYLTNGEFKDAMVQAGYEPEDPRMQNWVFGVSQRSLAFRWPR